MIVYENTATLSHTERGPGVMTLHGLSSFLQNNVLSIILIVVGLIVLLRSHNGDHKGAMTTVGIVLVGLAVIGVAVSGGAAGLGSRIANLLFG